MNPFGRRKTDQSPDQQAIARYRYLLKTAPPETIEQAHAEAFSQLTPEERRLVLQQIAQELPASERSRGSPRARKCGNRAPPSACSARPAAQARAA